MTMMIQGEVVERKGLEERSSVRLRGGGTGGEEEHLHPCRQRGDDHLLDDMQLPLTPPASNDMNIASHNPDDLDKMLATEFTNLSMEEREAAMMDLHGVADDMEESPEMIQQHLSRMDDCLSELLKQDTDGSTKPYEEALAQNPAYVKENEFRARFLRTERFDARASAGRFIKFFSTKKKLFGSDSMTKDIRIQDLSDEDRQALQSGVFQILPIKDRAGRSVLFHIDALKGDVESESAKLSRVRAVYYLVMSASKDLDNQRKGIVFVSVNTGNRGEKAALNGRESMAAMNILRGALALKLGAFHMCHDIEEKKAHATVVTALHAPHVRMRARHHEGSLDNIKLALMSFGIPCTSEVFPVLGEDEFDLSYHKSWYQRRAQQDLEAASVLHFSPSKAAVHAGPLPGDIIDFPSSKDIIMGRSALCQGHVGNVKYINQIHKQFQRYDAATQRYQKTAISAEIVEAMQASGARFLKERNDGSFILLSDDEAREKVSTAFRDRRKRVKAAATS